MLWIALRMFEERRNLLTSMSKTGRRGLVRNSSVQRLRETEDYIERIRGMLLGPQSPGREET
jgi:two-component system chemotaxis response regulator CheB